MIYLILVTLTSYLSAQIALRSNSPRKKRVVKTIGIGLVLSILSLCKIPNGIVHRFLNAFLDRNFADSFSSLFLLPIGLSFYSFQSISY
ncbi:MAG: hypothetical protein KDD35_08955, partial [Bdellovibrionales bacterium]|nr:hypothetical protein [Bdellovibrionales bacterium]